MATPQSSMGLALVRITLTLDIPVEEVLDPDPCISPDAAIPRTVQARIDQEKLEALPDTDEALFRRIEAIFAIRDAIHVANLQGLCRGAVAWRIERPV